ncbi:MAG: hydrogenase expression/formation protein HypE [Bacteroidota bacterium]
MKNQTILLGHGSGGKLSRELIQNIFFKHFGENDQHFATDATLLNMPGNHIAFTTDSYVVDPIFFPGGNIGKLAVCGTINDIAVSGALPLYLSCGFIIEEGFEFEKLEEIVITMAEEALKAGVKIVAGDTKVVDKGKCDKIFINTSGIGWIQPHNHHISYGHNIQLGDNIIINGNIAEHGVTIIGARNNILFADALQSDCASLNGLINRAMQVAKTIRFMRDATRGGIATVLCELVENRSFGIQIEEDKIPVSESVLGLCEVFGFDPLYIANEGKLLMVVAPEDTEKVLEALHQDTLGTNACVIGKIISENPRRVILNTQIGGKRIIDMLTGEQLPRIC